MNYKHYREQISQVHATARKAKMKIAEAYAFSNNEHGVGDMIEDHIGRIKIETVRLGLDHRGEPCCVYYGPKYTKKGTPFKDGSGREVWQTNINK